MFNDIETLHTIYIVTLTAAIFMLVVTIALFFLFDIRHVIARLFGFSERKEIKRIAASSQTGNLKDKYNRNMKEKVFTDTGNLRKKQTPQEMMGLTPPKPVSQSEELLADGLAPAAATAEYGDAATTALQQNQSEEAATYLGTASAYDSDSQTTLLDQTYGADSQTTVLNGPQTFSDVHFTVTRQITMIHTAESI